MIQSVLPVTRIADPRDRLRRRCAQSRASADLRKRCGALAPQNNDSHVVVALATPLVANPCLPACARTPQLPA
jgi:hypothetical protein